MGRPKKIPDDQEVVEVNLDENITDAPGEDSGVIPDQNTTLPEPPADDSILTHSEAKKAEKKKPAEKEKEKPVESIEEVLKHEHIFQCSFAPMGESNTVFIHKYHGQEYEYKLTMMNRLFIIPADMPKADKLRYRAALRDNGFVDITVINRGIEVKDPKNYEFRAVHPEHTNRNPVNCNLSFLMKDDNGEPMYHTDGPKKGQQIVKQVAVINGYVKTDDKLLYKALIGIGFRDAGRREVEA